MQIRRRWARESNRRPRSSVIFTFNNRVKRSKFSFDIQMISNRAKISSVFSKKKGICAKLRYLLNALGKIHPAKNDYIFPPPVKPFHFFVRLSHLVGSSTCCQAFFSPTTSTSPSSTNLKYEKLQPPKDQVHLRVNILKSPPPPAVSNTNLKSNQKPSTKNSRYNFQRAPTTICE